MIVRIAYLLKWYNIAEVQAVKLIILWRSTNTWCYIRALSIYLGLRNQIKVVIMRMRMSYWISVCACEAYFIMAVCEHSFWADKLINFLCFMISYLYRMCVNWILYTWSNIITWNQKLPSRSGNSKCNLAKRAWVAYWPYLEHGHTLAISY